MSVGLRGHLVRVAREVGALLNTIADDDEREQMQAEYEEALNDELYHGRGRLVPLAPVPPLGQVLPFRRLSERDFDRLITDPTKNAI